MLVSNNLVHNKTNTSVSSKDVQVQIIITWIAIILIMLQIVYYWVFIALLCVKIGPFVIYFFFKPKEKAIWYHYCIVAYECKKHKTKQKQKKHNRKML